MAKCYKDARTDYDNGKFKDAEEFIRCVWGLIIKNADIVENVPGKDHHITQRATKAFLNLYKVKIKPIYRAEIIGEIKRVDGGFKTYKSVGLWPWTEHSSDVIKKGKGFYSVPNDDFYHALLKVVLNIEY